jgi:deoxyguanosine kinase
MATSRPYIGFEGPIGAGKTTLAQLFATHIGATLILEDVDSNEFLADFYRDRQRWSLGAQLWFLAARHQQLGAVVASRTGPLVADYTYAKDGIFARALLEDRDLRLYQKISVGLTSRGAQPDLVVYVDAKNDVLLDRIRRRNRSYESFIDSKYLDLLRGAYRDYLHSTELRILSYDTSDLSLSSESDLIKFYQTILNAHAAPGESANTRSLER